MNKIFNGFIQFHIWKAILYLLRTFVYPVMVQTLYSLNTTAYYSCSASWVTPLSSWYSKSFIIDRYLVQKHVIFFQCSFCLLITTPCPHDWAKLTSENSFSFYRSHMSCAFHACASRQKSQLCEILSVYAFPDLLFKLIFILPRTDFNFDILLMISG